MLERQISRMDKLAGSMQTVSGRGWKHVALRSITLESTTTTTNCSCHLVYICLTSLNDNDFNSTSCHSNLAPVGAEPIQTPVLQIN